YRQRARLPHLPRPGAGAERAAVRTPALAFAAADGYPRPAASPDAGPPRALPADPRRPDQLRTVQPTRGGGGINTQSAIDAAVTLASLCEQVRGARGVAHKRDIDAVMQALGTHPLAAGGQPIPLGDDCAAIPDGDGWLLFAIEGFVNEFVEKEPWFAGYCGVMVNVSDIHARGGRPIAVVDALWSRDGDAAQPVLAGMAEASRIYGVPIVGGHSNRRNDREQLSVAILGRANRLLTSFDAKPGEHLVAAIDLRGRFHEPHAYWDASTGAPAARLRADLDLLPAIAEDGLARAAKDISM